MKKYNFLGSNRKLFGWIIFALIVAIALFLRLYKIDSLPVGLNPNEAFYGNQAIIFLNDISLKSFYSAILGGGIFVKFIIASIGIFGNSIFALRIVPVAFGVLGVIMTFVLAKKWFNTRTALIVGFSMAISPWMISLSRTVSPASMQPFLVSLCLYLATMAILKNKMVYYILFGAALSAGLYSFFAFFAFLPVVIIGFIVLSIKNKQWLKQSSTNILIGLISFLVLITPMLFVFFRHPAIYTDHIASSFVWARNINEGKIVTTLADNTTKGILAFNFRGDEDYRYNLAGLPLLNTFMGVMFILGIMITFVRIRRLKYSLLISLLIFSLLPVILFPANGSLSLRLSVCAPCVFLFIGIAVNYLLAKWYAIFPINALARNTGTALIFTLMFLSFWQSYKQYFVAWAQDPKTYYASSQDSTEIAKYLINKQFQQNPAFLVMDMQDLPTVDYLTNGKTNFTQLDIEKIKSFPIDNGKKVFIVQNESNANEIMNILKAKFPNGQENEKLSDYTDQKLFYVYVANQ